MGVATQIVENLLGATEGWFGVNHPFSLAKRRQVRGQRFRVTERLQRRKKLELAGVKSGLQVFEEQTSEQTREHPDRQEEARTAGDPMLTIRTDTTPRHDTMAI